MWKSLHKILTNSVFDVIGQLGQEINLLKKTGSIEIKRVKQESQNHLIFRLQFQNKSKSPIKVFSAIVSDFFLPATVELKQVLEHGWLQSSPSTYKKLFTPTKKNKFFLKRDHNYHSFSEKFGYLSGSVVSEWFTLLRFNDLSLLTGAITSKNQFSQIFLRDERSRARVRFTCQFDGLLLYPGETWKTEKIIFILGKEQEILDQYTKLLSESTKINKPSRPIKALCCSYYWRGNYIDEKILNQELDALEKLPSRLDIEYVQIDSGYCRNWGDWLDYKERFPSGFRRIIARINKMGYKAGIWFAPFLAVPWSKVCRKNPDWFLKNDKNKFIEAGPATILGRMTKNPALCFRPIDPTNHKFRRHLKKIVNHFIDLGFRLIKLDFLYTVCLANNYSLPLTRAQALRSGVELIAKTAGSDTHILTAISPISPLVGLVDSVRTSADSLNPYVCNIPMLNSWVNNKMLENNLKNNDIRKFFNAKIWTNDADCLIFRDKTGINKLLIDSHKNFVRLYKTSIWIGDSIARLNILQKNEILDFINNN